MKTVLEVITELGLKPGDKVTNGEHTWTIQTYQDRFPRTKATFYLKGVDSRTPLVAGVSLGIVVIPNLRRAPKTIRVYKWVYEVTNHPPRVTISHYPAESDVRKLVEDRGEDILWIKRLDECMKTVEVECEC